ncbi:hypothetical protein FSARC_12562 [Fusarium sarcochroum]|uniref:Zn(2)-C6 fungal-type domain-containing protein n=1 Tax=Fusarium sarcochroum TaxID=1208366 RepID=A0A8H4WWP9_9HYPO|nr:hypothetical protein FSARC_12562 [Fusarium sarcochroum]
MPPAKAMPKPYSRRPIQKSFFGCARCKARKIKCDEKKPSCTQCGAKRINCPGYPLQPRLRWSRKHEILESDQFVSINRSRPRPETEQHASIASPTSPLGEGRERSQNNDRAELVENVRVHKPNASGSISNYDRHASSLEEDPLISTRGTLSSQTEDLPVEWEWGADLLHAFLAPDDHTSLFFHHPSSTSGSSHPSPASSLRLQQETSPNNEAEQDLTIPGTYDELFTFGTEDSNSISRLRVPNCDFTTPESLKGDGKRIQFQMTPQLAHVPGELVTFYFSVVCPILSTFDSEHNLFRSFIVQRWQASPLIFHTIQSMAAAKLVWLTPDMKAHAFHYRSMALNTLDTTLTKSTRWNSEILFAILMLGISSCWFDISDLGFVYLEAVQQAISNDKVDYMDGCPPLTFFKDALTYWEMISSVVNDKVTFHDYSKTKPPRQDLIVQNRRASVTSPPRVSPHSWTGVASEPQALFTRVARQIRGLRSFETAHTTSGISLDNATDFRGTLKALDEEIWACNLPRLHHISNSGDENTPAIHHLLLAEAYMLANLYQLYFVFGNLRKARVAWIKETTGHRQTKGSWAEEQISSWESLLEEDDGTDKWLRFLGRSVIIRLEQIQTTSGTSCVQALLLLVAASSLYTSEGRDADDDEEVEIRQARQFVLNRLRYLAEANLSVPIRHVTSVVLQIFKRLDVGANVFWMDVLQAMGTLTIIG